MCLVISFILLLSYIPTACQRLSLLISHIITLIGGPCPWAVYFHCIQWLHSYANRPSVFEHLLHAWLYPGWPLLCWELFSSPSPMVMCVIRSELLPVLFQFHPPWRLPDTPQLGTRWTSPVRWTSSTPRTYSWPGWRTETCPEQKQPQSA